MENPTEQDSPAASQPGSSQSLGNEHSEAARPAGAPSTNLTEQEKLARRLTAPAPRADHYLLVFKRSGKVWKLMVSLGPGEPYRKPLFTASDSLISYVVRSDPNLRYRFSPPLYKSHDQLHSFQLQLALEYRISDPVALVEKLELDPLRRVVDEIDSFLKQRIKSLDWASVEHERIDLEEILFQRRGPSDTDQSGYATLRRFAGLQGLGIQRIAVVRELPEKELQVAAAELQNHRDRQSMFHEHGTQSLRQNFEIELDDQKQGARRRNEIGDEISKSIAHAFSDNVHSLDDIKPGITKLAAIQPMIAGVVSGASPSPTLTTSTLPPAAMAFLPSNSAATPLGALLTEIVNVLGSLACDPDERRQILSLALHIAAETLRGGDADTLDPYTGAIRGVLDLSSPLFRRLTKEQVKLLKRLQDTEALKKDLG